MSAKKAEASLAPKPDVQVQGQFGVPQFDRTKLRARKPMRHAGKLAIDPSIQEILDTNNLHARWINEDDMGRAQEAQDYLNYRPLTKDGSRIVRQVGGGMTGCLMVTPRDLFEESQIDKKKAIIDPITDQKGKRINAATGKEEVIDLSIDEGAGEYAPDGGDRIAKQESGIGSPLR